jgi:hypothetical protein
MKLLALAFFAFMLAAESDPESNIDVNPKLAVEFQNERLGVHAEEVPLRELLTEIEEKCGINFILRDENAAAILITLDLKDLAPAQALEEILRGLNFAYIYSGARLSRVVVLPKGIGIAGPHGNAPSLGGLRGQFPGAGNLVSKPPPIQKSPEQIKEASRIASKLDAIDNLEDKNDPKSNSALADMFSDPSREVKDAALEALADKEGTNVTQLIQRGLNDRDPEFRIEVLEVLADRGDLESLRKAKSDPNQDVRERAADLLESATP